MITSEQNRAGVAARRVQRGATLLLVLTALLLATGCNKLKARDQLNKGVGAYKNARYEEAIDHFQQAVTFDPQP